MCTAAMTLSTLNHKTKHSSRSSLTMPGPTLNSDDSHQQLLDSIDMALSPRPFRNPNWRPSARRNKNLKQVLGEASRKEASVLATQNNSGATTPLQGVSTATLLPSNVTGGNVGPVQSAGLLQAAQSLSTLVLERNAATAAGNGTTSTGPAVTYSNIESAPSLRLARQKPYCDITGLPAPYTDPKTRLRYHDREIFGVVRALPQGVAEQYLEARGAHVVLK